MNLGFALFLGGEEAVTMTPLTARPLQASVLTSLILGPLES